MTLKDCLYRMVHENKKPLKVIAEEIDISENYLYRSVTPEPDESKKGTGCRFPLKKLIPLIRCTGEVAFPLPSANSTMLDLCRMVMTSVKEFGEMMAAMEAAMADGSISETEKAAIIKEGNQAVQEIVNLLKHLEG